MGARGHRRLAAWAALATASVLLVGTAAAAPTAAEPGPVQRAVRPCSQGLVALTFDDGPSSSVTPALLRVLERQHVPATFFMVGSRVASAPGVARAVDRAGFAIGNHTWVHADLTTQTDAEIRSTLRTTRRQMLHQHLHPGWLMRPPYGAIDDRVRDVVRSMGYTPVLWTIDPRDWSGISAAEIRSRVVGAVRPHATNIVLQHDGVANSPATLAAVPGEISSLRARGYCFAGLDRAGHPTPPVPVASVTADHRAVAEGGRVGLTVHLDRPTSRPTSARLELDAPPSVDHAVSLSTHLVRFGVGQQQAHLWLHSRQDTFDEHDESVTVRVGGGGGIRPSQKQATVTLGDDDRSPLVDLVDARVQAAAETDTPVDVAVRLDGATDLPVRVVVRGELGRAVTVVPPASRTGWLTLTVPPESADQPTRVVTVELVRVVNARPGEDAAVTVDPPDPVPPPDRARVNRRGGG
ncbi:MAG: polysaccharide deacetylase family protein [Nocardioides sp.]|nr:polysaccharide deacetylase family protein [Nocardioidaceae bacterium]MCB8956267.1 polysaccharide deacetylase family protein [Nocardioides sp.]